MEPRDGGIAASPEEEQALRKRMVEGGPLTCPRCHGPLQMTSAPPRSDVAYVRNRAILDCSACGFRVALDRK